MAGVVDTRLAAATLSGTGARLHCTQGLAGRGDVYQCGLDRGRSRLIISSELKPIYIQCGIHWRRVFTCHIDVRLIRL